MRNAYKVKVRRSEGRMSFGKSRHRRWKDIIKMNLKETGLDGVAL